VDTDDKGRIALTLDADELDALRIGIVRARFNDRLTTALADRCRDEFALIGLDVDTQVTEHTVPGALEIPLALQGLALSGRYDALVAIGCVIRGETYHFELVSNESGSGITRVQLDQRIPIANVVLTVDTDEQAWARVDKGAEAAQVAVEMVALLRRVSEGL